MTITLPPFRADNQVLHLLREDSVERAVESFHDAASIYERNIAAQAKL